MDSVDKQGEPVPFRLWYFTFNEDQQTGGELKKSFATVRFKASPKLRFAKNKKDHVKKRVNPNHSIHGTVNIQMVNTLEFRTVHTWLIMQINDQPVTLGNYG
jgi:hypothetical protein